MITTVVFSRDRAMQLDLLLNSLRENGANLFRPLYVLYRATSADHERSYAICSQEYEEVTMIPDGPSSFRLAARLIDSDHGCFFTDDSVLFRPIGRKTPHDALVERDVLCFSLRLGRNTTWCYPHARSQRLPEFEERNSFLIWGWKGADGDFGYPGSVDGHVFRGATLRAALHDAPRDSNPNKIEEHLVSAFGTFGALGDRGKMSSYAQSHLLGIPVNRVNQTHPNRFGDRHPMSADELLARYLVGQRVDLRALDFSNIRGAHQEIELIFREGE